jgi:hypothetical protein
MAVRQVVVSDLSGEEIAEEQHARLVISEHPSLIGSPVELDITAAEAAKLQTAKIDLVNIEVHEPNRPRRIVVMEASAFNALFGSIDMPEIVRNARRISAPAAAVRRVRQASAPRSDAVKLDYTAMENIGMEHRGRVTEQEAKLVRNNLETASANRQRQGKPPIDQTDAKEIKRYGFGTIDRRF